MNLPLPGDAAPESETDRQADAMKDQLRKDVASWSAARSGDQHEQAAKQIPTPAVSARAPRKAKAVPAVVVAAPAEKKPFKMSYDGMTDRDFMARRIRLGAR